jgi:ATP-dependent exoDNAse (exonuclease V) beta subunit
MKSTGEQALQIISKEHLEFTIFNRSMLPNHFSSLVNKTDRTKFFDQSVLKKRIDENELLSKTKPKNTLLTAEKILPALLKLYSDSELLYQQLIQTKLILQSIIPLAVLNHINKELNTIKEDNNIRLNAEFNQLISDNIQDQPAPFIYERIGQSFMHYFIDEMQDTSVLQWKNLIPLIDNSVIPGKNEFVVSWRC